MSDQHVHQYSVHQSAILHEKWAKASIPSLGTEIMNLFLLTFDQQVEPFLGKIRVPTEVTQELPIIDGVEWVFENKIPLT